MFIHRVARAALAYNMPMVKESLQVQKSILAVCNQTTIIQCKSLELLVFMRRKTSNYFSTSVSLRLATKHIL